MSEDTAVQQAPKQSIAAKETGLALGSIDDYWRFAGIVMKSGMVPKSLMNAGDPQSAIMLALQQGAEIGLSPMMSIQNIYVVNNKPSLYGPVALGLVRSHRAFGGIIENEIGTFPHDDYGWQVQCWRKNATTGELVERTFTVKDAKLAKLWRDTNNGETPWHKYPKDMLKYRARWRAINDCFSDALYGLSVVDQHEAEYENQKPPTRDVTPENEPVKASSDPLDKFVEEKAAKEESPPAKPKAKAASKPKAKPKKNTGALWAEIEKLSGIDEEAVADMLYKMNSEATQNADYSDAQLERVIENLAYLKGEKQDELPVS